MPFTQFTNLDFDQIKTSIKDYLRANSTFTDFDFEGSNFSTLIDTLAYNTYITAFNSNMIVNESFIDSATLRENVVSLARNIGYTPRSKTAAKAIVDIKLSLTDNNLSDSIDLPDTITLEKGIVCTSSGSDESFTFSIPDDITTTVDSNGEAEFKNIEILQGTLLTKQFEYDGSLDQRFILNNPSIDTSTLRVTVGTTEYLLSNNIFNIDKSSTIFFLQEVQDERYEILFGDGIFGKKIGAEGDGTQIKTSYIVTDGPSANGSRTFSFSGSVTSSNVTINNPTVTSVQPAQNGSDIETVESIKYYAPRIYSSQYRAVTQRDYEAIIKTIYPDTESVSVVGGEQLNPPQFGVVQISIKPKNGSFVSDFNKSNILSELKKYTVSGINQKIVDLKILYVELDSTVYFNNSKVTDPNNLRTEIINSLELYKNSLNFNKFGGRLKYSKLQQVIDKTNTSITSNITKIIIRRDLKPILNAPTEYELCFGNRFHVNSEGFNIKSTGFKISGVSDTVYFTDVPNKDKTLGILSIVNRDGTVIVKSAGTVDYLKGEVIIGISVITSTLNASGVIEIQAFPESNDVVGLRDLYLALSTKKSTINILRDVIESGDEISGTQFVSDFYTSSYSNGSLIRK